METLKKIALKFICGIWFMMISITMLRVLDINLTWNLLIAIACISGFLISIITDKIIT
jgi:hypothetical protein